MKPVQEKIQKPLPIVNNFVEVLQRNDIFAFIPQSPCTLLPEPKQKISYLELIKSILLIAHDALTAFLSGKLIQFDPQVGESACQIRAFQILFMFLRMQDISFKEQIEKSIKNIYYLLENLTLLLGTELKKLHQRRDKTLKYIEDNLTFNEYLITKNISICFSKNELFLIQSFLLSLAKDIETNYINYKNFCERLKISKYLADKLIQHNQRSLSKISLSFLKDLLSRTNRTQLLRLFNIYQSTDQIGREVIPCYFSLYLVLELLKHFQINILLIVDRTSPIEKDIVEIKFSYDPAKKRYLGSSEKIMGPCFTIRGDVEYQNSLEFKELYINNLLSFPLEDIVLANAAQHVQFADKNLSEDYNIHINDENTPTNKLEFINKFKLYKKIAQNMGCSLANKQLFLIKHIYPSIS
jgi:hypothetical protein